MFQAQYLQSNTSIFSPWMPRQGDQMEVTAELVQKNGGGAKLEVFVFTKAADSGGNGGVSPSPRLTVSSVGRGSAKFSSLKNLVRFKIQNPSTTAGDYILFRILSPTWYDTVGA